MISQPFETQSFGIANAFLIDSSPFRGREMASMCQTASWVAMLRPQDLGAVAAKPECQINTYNKTRLR